MPKINSDSLIFRIGNKVFDVIVVSLLWFVCCIPVITAGASTTALYDTVFRNILAKTVDTAIRDFLNALRIISKTRCRHQ